ncbi:hypothetical protein COLO4_20514 [Corchorus olitorius]|uniref:Uncharacterized protein n=1 Tax=Corchorus olitorius TaxID=93759 RepID=A0A1R3IZG0_9ROSI|nr:hypothetical protein COLO4_20514 [Corchorus olitorius]
MKKKGEKRKNSRQIPQTSIEDTKTEDPPIPATKD